MKTFLNRSLLWRLYRLVIAVPMLGSCFATHHITSNETFLAEIATRSSLSSPKPGADLFAGEKTLSRKTLFQAVLRENPLVASARQTWRNTAARYSQVTALDDPTLSYQSAPGTLGSKHGYGQTIQVHQNLPWPGQRELQGAIAKAEAEIQKIDIKRVQQHLVLAASLLYDDYYAVERALDINTQHIALMKRLLTSVESLYAVGRGVQQDALQADLELALLDRQKLVLKTRKKIIAAQLNGLLHRSPAEPLPPPPRSIPTVSLPNTPALDLSKQASSLRPEIRASTYQLEKAHTALDLAKQKYFPHFKVGGAYNSMWAQPEHQFMLGLSFNIPLQIQARNAGVQQATTQLALAKADQQAVLDNIKVEVEKAFFRLEESIAHVALYQTRILPAAQRQISAAEAGYQNGQNNFAVLMEAERRLRRFELESEEARANTWRNLAMLAHAIGASSFSDLIKGEIQ